MIKHKQNKKMPGIYNLPLKCNLCSTFSIKQKQRPFLRVSQTKLVPASVGGDICSKKGEIQLATWWDYNHVLVFLQFCY